MRIRAALSLACAALAPAATASAASAPATFTVGASTASIAPLPGVPVYAGGFGYSPPITTQSDPQRSPMEVRALKGRIRDVCRVRASGTCSRRGGR